LTTRGMKEKEMEKIAELINLTILNPTNSRNLSKVKKEVAKLTEKFPIYKNLIRSLTKI